MSSLWCPSANLRLPRECVISNRRCLRLREHKKHGFSRKELWHLNMHRNGLKAFPWSLAGILPSFEAIRSHENRRFLLEFYPFLAFYELFREIVKPWLYHEKSEERLRIAVIVRNNVRNVQILPIFQHFAQFTLQNGHFQYICRCCFSRNKKTKTTDFQVF